MLVHVCGGGIVSLPVTEMYREAEKEEKFSFTQQQEASSSCLLSVSKSLGRFTMLTQSPSGPAKDPFHTPSHRCQSYNALRMLLLLVDLHYDPLRKTVRGVLTTTGYKIKLIFTHQKKCENSCDS